MEKPVSGEQIAGSLGVLPDLLCFCQIFRGQAFAPRELLCDFWFIMVNTGFVSCIFSALIPSFK
jgi:hypothetical protein